MILQCIYLLVTITVLQNTLGSVISNGNKDNRDLIAGKKTLVDSSLSIYLQENSTVDTSSSKVNSALSNKIKSEFIENSGKENAVNTGRNFVSTTIITSQPVSVNSSEDDATTKNTTLKSEPFKIPTNGSDFNSKSTLNSERTEENPSLAATTTTTTEPAVLIPTKIYSSKSQVIPALRAYQKYLRPLHISPNYAKLSKSSRTSDVVPSPVPAPAPRQSTPCPNCGRLICGNNGRYCPCQTYRSGLSRSNNALGEETMWRSGLLDAALNPGRTLWSWLGKSTSTPEVNRPIKSGSLGQSLDHRPLPNQQGAFQIQPLHSDFIIQPNLQLPQQTSFYAMLNNHLYPHTDGCLEPIIP